MNNNFYKTTTCIVLTFFCICLFLPVHTLASGERFGLEEAGAMEIVESDNLGNSVTGIINIFLGFLGIISVSMILYAGFTWMTSLGNEEKVTKAKKIIYRSVIGLFVILAAYAISNFVIDKLYYATSGGGEYDHIRYY